VLVGVCGWLLSGVGAYELKGFPCIAWASCKGDMGCWSGCSYEIMVLELCGNNGNGGVCEAIVGMGRFGIRDPIDVV
jgi:hypothetical protein